MNRKRLLIVTVIVVAAVVATILLDTILANHHPAITGLESERERVLPRTSCQIVCSASDADGDELSYNWSASEGLITGKGDAVTWTAPNMSGKVTITVTVSDIAGNMASRNLVFKAVSCSAWTFGSCAG